MRQSIINKLNSNNMSKKVIEQIKVVKYFGKGEKEPTVIDNPSARELTTVAKAIDPEYQKVIDQNAKLVEALEKVKDMQENRQKLFNHMSTEHGLTLLESEMNSIYSICIGHEEYVKYLNWLHSKPVDTKTVDAVDTTFWRRLEMFVSNIQVNDMAGEEEKQYIIHVIESKKEKL